MFKRNDFNIIKEYEEKLIDNYYNSSFIDDNKIIYLKKCLNKIKGNNCFLHITPNLNEIVSSKKILCSSGGLGGVVYSIPYNENKIHNLGIYIIEKEMPMFLKKDNYIINGFLIYPKNNSLGYIDYLEFGKFYFDICKNKKYNIPKYQLDMFVKDIYKKINIIKYLNKNKLFEIFEIMNSNKVLKIYLYEIVIEYLFIFQKNNKTEMNNKIVKDIIYELSPQLKDGFALSNFNIDFYKFKQIISEKKYDISNINDYLYDRINFYLKKYLIDDKNNLYGQVIFREFNFRKELEKEFSKLLWKEAREKKYGIVTYILPKGEIGILPINGNKIYKCDIVNCSCKSIKSVKVRIVKKLKMRGIMRNPYKEEKNGITNKGARRNLF